MLSKSLEGAAETRVNLGLLLPQRGSGGRQGHTALPPTSQCSCRQSGVPGAAPSPGAGTGQESLDTEGCGVRRSLH